MRHRLPTGPRSASLSHVIADLGFALLLLFAVVAWLTVLL